MAIMEVWTRGGHRGLLRILENSKVNQPKNGSFAKYIVLSKAKVSTEVASVMRIMKLAKYRLKAQVEKDEGPSGEG